MAGRKSHSSEALQRVAEENQNTVIPSLLCSDATLGLASERTVAYRDAPPPVNTILEDKAFCVTNFGFRPIETLDAAEDLVKRWGGDRTAVLNMANATTPGGGYLWGATAQEESLCRRSSLYLHINKPGFYPIQPRGGLWSEEVKVIRQSDDRGSALLEPSQQFSVGVISAAAIKNPRLNEEGAAYANPEDEELTKRKIQTILRIAKLHGQRALVLGAFGCGAFHNPPRLMAELFKTALTQDPEFRGAFDEVVFAILSRDGDSNIKPWAEVWDDVLALQGAIHGETSGGVAGSSASVA